MYIIKCELMDNYKLKCNFKICKIYIDIFHKKIFNNEKVLVDNNNNIEFLPKKCEILCHFSMFQVVLPNQLNPKLGKSYVSRVCHFVDVFKKTTENLI